MSDVEMKRMPKPRANWCTKGELVKTVGVAGLLEKEEAGVVAEVSRPERPSQVPLPVSNRRKEQDHSTNKVVQRKDSKSAPDVKGSVPVDLRLAVVQDSRDEEA